MPARLTPARGEAYVTDCVAGILNGHTGLLARPEPAGAGAALSAVVGVFGALWATVARNAGFTQAIGHALMDTALALLAYAVLAYRSLLPARVAQRTFYRSLLGGVLTAIYVTLLLVAEPAV